MHGSQEKASDWTPELRIQAAKELVTGTLGIALILFTLSMTYRSFGMAGRVDQMKDAMGMLSLLFGLAGVVVGYYFGRMPADARAAQAQKTSEDAIGKQMATRELMKTAMEKSRAMGDQMHETMAEAGITPRKLSSMSSDALTPNVEALHRMAKDLQQGLSDLDRIFQRAAPLAS
jgi:hypothetical protein